MIKWIVFQIIWSVTKIRRKSQNQSIKVIKLFETENYEFIEEK
jgi:hypothetical protein